MGERKQAGLARINPMMTKLQLLTEHCMSQIQDMGTSIYTFYAHKYAHVLVLTEKSRDKQYYEEVNVLRSRL